MKHIFIILTTAIIFSACVNNQAIKEVDLSPSLKLNDIQISAVKLDSIELNTKITIRNPYPIDLNLKNIMVNVYYEDKIISSYGIDGNMTLKSLTSNDMQLKSTINIIDLVKLVKNYTDVEYLPFKIEVSFALPMPKTLNVLSDFQLKDSIYFNMPTINPQISLKSMKLKSPFSIEGVFNIKNATKSKFMIDDIEYSINLNDKNFKGVVKNIKNNDGSFDMVLDDLNILSMGISAYKDITKTSLEIKTNIQIGEIPYKIPIVFNKNFIMD